MLFSVVTAVALAVLLPVAALILTNVFMPGSPFNKFIIIGAAVIGLLIGAGIVYSASNKNNIADQRASAAAKLESEKAAAYNTRLTGATIGAEAARVDARQKCEKNCMTMYKLAGRRRSCKENCAAISL